MPDTFLCEIIDKRWLTDTAHSITIRCGGLARAAMPGQFIHVKCGDALLLRRPFGICSIDCDDVRFVFEVKGGGTRWLSERVAGSALDVLGPLGKGFKVPDGRFIVVGGGLGAPPMLFAAQSAKGRVTAILGFRDWSKALLIDEFKAICEDVILTTDDGSAGLHGLVTAPLEGLLREGGYEAVLTCGQLAMQKAVAGMCGRYRTKCQASLEERMGCGVGACRVCVCALRSGKDGKEYMGCVCKEGPVFDAENVLW